MTLIAKPLLLSAGVHVAILAALLAFGFIRIPEETITHTVHLKLSRSAAAGFSGPAEASRPEDVERDGRRNWTVPPGNREDRNESLPQNHFFEPVPKIVELNTNLSHRDISFRELSERISEAILDPLEGMEGFLPSEEKPEDVGFVRKWSLSWEEGGERGILSSLEIDGDVFPDTPERLSNITVRIAVSPQGEVLSAEIEEQGSGDIRIDRYLISWALNLVFEPIPPESSIQNGEFRLYFSDGDA